MGRFGASPRCVVWRCWIPSVNLGMVQIAAHACAAGSARDARGGGTSTGVSPKGLLLFASLVVACFHFYV